MRFFRGAVPKWLREQSAKLRCGGSNPPGASIYFFKKFGVFRLSVSLLCSSLRFIGHGFDHGCTVRFLHAQATKASLVHCLFQMACCGFGLIDTPLR